MSELAKRVLFAVPAAILFLAITWFGGIYFEITLALLALLTVWEVHRIMGQAGSRGILWLSVIIGILIWLSHRLPEWVLLATVTAMLLITIWAVLDKKTDYSTAWLSTLFTGIYAPVGFLMIVFIRELGGNTGGFWLVLCFFLMIWGNDIFAYFGGKRFGKRQLAPKISPKKTWEGFWSGFVGAAAGFSLAFVLAESFMLPFWSIIPSVCIVSVAGPVGDIAASSLKRKAGVKDSSSLLPGHGGFFDRFDSMLLSAPFIFFLFYFLIV